MRIILFTLLAATAGCVGDHHGGIGGPLPAANTVTYRIDAGASTTVSPGDVAGYGITASADGTYRLVWTGDSNASGSFHEFWGSAWTPGHFSAFAPGCNGHCPLESNDFVSGIVSLGSGERIDWDTIATDGLDGFDVSTDTEPVYFDFVIDGTHYPSLVFFPSGGAIASVSTFPFGLTTQ